MDGDLFQFKLQFRQKSKNVKIDAETMLEQERYLKRNLNINKVLFSGGSEIELFRDHKSLNEHMAILSIYLSGLIFIIFSDYIGLFYHHLIIFDNQLA